MEFKIKAIATLRGEADKETRSLKLKGSDLELETEAPDLDESLHGSLFNKDGFLTKFGCEIATRALVSSLIANLHYAHQASLIDSSEHYRAILKDLEEGFISNINLDVV
jgi:hypothetical protein